MMLRQYSFSDSQFCFHFIHYNWSELNLLQSSLQSLISEFVFSLSWSIFDNYSRSSSFQITFLCWSFTNFFIRSSILSIISSYILHCLETISSFNFNSLISPLSFFMVPRKSLRFQFAFGLYFQLLLTFSGILSFLSRTNSFFKQSFSSFRQKFYLEMFFIYIQSLSALPKGKLLLLYAADTCPFYSAFLWAGKKFLGDWLAPMLIVSERFLVDWT